MSTATVDLAPRLHAMFVGDSRWHEFAEVWRSLQSATFLTHAADVTKAVARIAQHETPPDLIVIAQIRPGQIDPRDVHELRRLAPLTRVVAVVGSWCEGEARTGRPWPAVPRLYWHQWPVAGEREIRRLIEMRDSWWQLPPTATPDERFMLERRGDDVSPRNGLIVIAASRWEPAEALADACGAAGYQSVWHRAEQPARAHGATAVVWDGSGLEPDDQQQLRTLRAEYPGLPLVALLNYPRVETIALARQCGATAVLSKPFLVDDLLAAFVDAAHLAAAH